MRRLVSAEIHYGQNTRMTFKGLRKHIYLGDNAYRTIKAHRKQADFMQLLEMWKYEEALTGGRGYWKPYEVDSFLAYDEHDIYPALGIKGEGDD